MSIHDSIRAVQWQDGVVRLLDQRYLPAKETYLELRSVKDVADAIRDMVVRGAPAIGIAAAYGVVLAIKDHYSANHEDWRQELESDLTYLEAARPTAINLSWAIGKMREVVQNATSNPLENALALAQQIHQQDLEANHRMGELGAALIDVDSGVLTHCNTGSLATGGYGTALGVIRSAYAAGKIQQVYADETRPWLQGSRLTAWELMQDKIPVTLIADSAAASLMNLGKVQWVIVGADRITANGDVANKIGTYSLAVNARHHGVKMMVVAPTSTIDMQCPDGEQIPIEQRNPSEVLSVNGQKIGPDGASAWNPSFDVTPAELVDVIVTEQGIIESPNSDRLMALMKNTTSE
ncbi:S-methyl-5-thioribose-1-phosphate isomerase [Kaarinaea lacus]